MKSIDLVKKLARYLDDSGSKLSIYGGRVENGQLEIEIGLVIENDDGKFLCRRFYTLTIDKGWKVSLSDDNLPICSPKPGETSADIAYIITILKDYLDDLLADTEVEFPEDVKEIDPYGPNPPNTMQEVREYISGYFGNSIYDVPDGLIAKAMAEAGRNVYGRHIKKLGKAVLSPDDDVELLEVILGLAQEGSLFDS